MKTILTVILVLGTLFLIGYIYPEDGVALSFDTIGRLVIVTLIFIVVGIILWLKYREK